MARITNVSTNLNTNQLVDKQSQLWRERNQSQFARLLSTSPSFATYYSIDGLNSSAELGTREIMSYVSDDSPIKYKKVNGLALYSIEAIEGEISFDEILGTYTEYEGTGLILNCELSPLPGDHFVIPAFNPDIIFIVNNVLTRAIRGEDHYAFTYSVVPVSRVEEINKQVVETYEAVFRNIGTEDKVIIRNEEFNLLNECIAKYAQVVESYLDEFYDAEIAYLRTPEWLSEDLSLGYGTCKYLIRFLMDHNIIYFDKILDMIFAFESPLPFESRHNKIYRRDFPLTIFTTHKLKPNYDMWITYQTLAISLFRDIEDIKLVESVEFANVVDEPTSAYHFMLANREFVNKVLNHDISGLSPLESLVVKIYNKDNIELTEFDAAMNDYDTTDIFRFYFIPYALFGLAIKIKAIQIK